MTKKELLQKMAGLSVSLHVLGTAIKASSEVTRRQREARDDFKGLRARLETENHLRALMLSQRLRRGEFSS